MTRSRPVAAPAPVSRHRAPGAVRDGDRCYRAVQGRDRRFDGVFYTAVRTTGIYCRPSCPATTPRRRNVEFFVTAAAAQSAGYRACRRCRPDATPGSPDWDARADVAGRAMRLIADGVVEREGVPGLASRTGYSSRHLVRILTDQLGAGPLSLARAHRAHTARILIETTTMSFTDVAFAAGFASLRQFNATIAEVYATTPTALRARRRLRPGEAPAAGRVTVSLAVRQPFDGPGVLRFLASRAVAGVEVAGTTSYSRLLRLPHGHGCVRLALADRSVSCLLDLSDLRDLGPAVERCRRLLDLDADPVAVDAHLSADPALHPLVTDRPGIRVPGSVDGFEMAVRAVLGQQISVAGARTLAGRLVERYGRPVAGAAGSDAISGARLTHLFPDAPALAAVDPAELPLTRTRSRSLVALAAAVAEGQLVLDRGADRADVRRRLLELPGIGSWTADYIMLRALGDPDVFLPTDLGVRVGLGRLNIGGDPARGAEPWRPWRSYALMHVWAAAAPSRTQTTTDTTAVGGAS